MCVCVCVCATSFFWFSGGPLNDEREKERKLEIIKHISSFEEGEGGKERNGTNGEEEEKKKKDLGMPHTCESLAPELLDVICCSPSLSLTFIYFSSPSSSLRCFFFLF